MDTQVYTHSYCRTLTRLRKHKTAIGIFSFIIIEEFLTLAGMNTTETKIFFASCEIPCSATDKN